MVQDILIFLPRLFFGHVCFSLQRKLPAIKMVRCSFSLSRENVARALVAVYFPPRWHV